MNTGFLIFGILAFLLSGASLYFSFNTRAKIDRLNKRYNHLLRGYGDVNMEELLIQFGTDLAVFKEKDEKTSQRLENMETWVKTAEEENTRILNERLDAVTGQLSGDFHSAEEKLSSDMKRLDEQVYARMDELAGESAKQASQLTDRMDRIEKETEERLTNQAQSQKKELKVQASLLKDQLSLAISKVSLSRYNAFEELSGSHSFSLVMLDEHRNGIVLTSIYSSEGSNIFCKTITNGQAEQALSHEEGDALARAIQK